MSDQKCKMGRGKMCSAPREEWSFCWRRLDHYLDVARSGCRYIETGAPEPPPAPPERLDVIKATFLSRRFHDVSPEDVEVYEGEDGGTYVGVSEHDPEHDDPHYVVREESPLLPGPPILSFYRDDGEEPWCPHQGSYLNEDRLLVGMLCPNCGAILRVHPNPPLSTVRYYHP